MPYLLKAEFYKLFHSWYFWGIGLFNLFISSVLLMDGSRKTSNLFFASLYNTPLLYFLTIVFAALFAGNDLEQRTLYSYISAGHKRSHVIFVKTLAYETACIAILIFPLLIHGLAGFLFLHESYAIIDNIFITAALIMFSASSMCMLPLFFSFLFRDIGKTLTISMIIFFLMIFLMNGDQTQTITNILPMGQLRLISLQNLSSAGICFITIDFFEIIIFYLGAYVVLCRFDLQ